MPREHAHSASHDEVPGTLALAQRRESRSRLRLKRTDLTFSLDEGMLDIAIRVRNMGSRATKPRAGSVEWAPFGAFVPWRPLATLDVPALRPGEVRIVRLRVPAPAPGGAGLPPWMPDALLEDPAGEPPASRRTIATRLLGRLLGPMTANEDLEFAGNLNVHIGSASVERHLSGPLRIHPGKSNAAAFFVGDGSKADRYRFELRGVPDDWNPMLLGPDNLTRASAESLLPGRWYSSATTSLVVFVVTPPATCRRGAAQVHVEQESSGKVAIVEFDLNPDAQAAGCYTV
jgi:hypothetical protein